MLIVKPFFIFYLTLCSLFISAQATKTDSIANDNKIYNTVETEASFPGGSAEWSKYLQKNLRGDVPSKNGAPVGSYTVIARFIVNKEGILSDIKTETKLGYGMEEEVARVISKSGKWNPAVQNGKNVNAYRLQPVTFLIENYDFEIQSQQGYTLFTNTDNELIITAKKVKPEDISLSVPGGKVTELGDGKFKVRINKPGRVTVEIINSKKDKVIGTASMVVKDK